MLSIAASLCILTQTVPVQSPASDAALVMPGRVAAIICPVDGIHPPAFKITFQDLPSLCVQRPWRTSMWITLDECECVE